MTNHHTHSAGKSRSWTSTMLVLLSLFALAACETTGSTRSQGSGETRAERLAASGQHDDAANAYMNLAADASGTERDRFALLAIEQWLDAGEPALAERRMARMQRPTVAALSPLYDTNTAAIALYRGDPDAALSILEPMSRQPLDMRDRLRVEALRADTWIQKRDPARAVELMTQRETWLNSSREIEQNRLRLWQGLLVSDPQVLIQAAELTTDEETRAWLQLGSLATSTGQQGIGWNNGMARWRDANPRHPATLVIREMESSGQDLLEYPRQVALLLPLSGPSAAAGKAIQNGFLGAYFATAGALDDRQSVRLYDVNAEGGASAAYQTAVADGAEFVVGPLLKNNVQKLASDMLIPVPVLTLNYLPEETPTPPGLYQFALAPEDEAASAAIRALGDGHTRAVALVPSNDWGRRVLQSFATEFEGLGGTLLDYRSYAPDKQDFANEIETLMGLAGSVDRYRRLRSNIGGNLQFDPRRRQDAEFIFLAAGSGPARLLKSQLKFHYSGDLPTYSTSSVYSLDGRSNSDLNGIMFADTPWLVDPQPWIRTLPETFAEHWPQERRLARLHAMGFDAYNLIASLFASRGRPIADLNGATGELFLDQHGRVHRRLAWAQFQRGQIVALPGQEETGGPIQDISDDGETIAPNAADEAPWDPVQQDL